jgi:fatty-acyl-CoA synthase
MSVGVQRGDHVGILMGNSGQWLEFFFACACIGATTVPINTRFKTEELGYCLKQADVSCLIFANTFLGIDYSRMLEKVEPGIMVEKGLPGMQLPKLRLAIMTGSGNLPEGAISYEKLLAGAGAIHDEALKARVQTVAPEDVLLIQYTSGTTSFPKGVMLSHANMLLDAGAAAVRMGVLPTDRYFSIRPFFHVAGSTLSILVALNTGCCLLTLSKFDVSENLKMLQDERCTLISGNDTIFLMLMAHEDFPRTKLHLRGGWAAAGHEVMQKIHDVMGATEVCNAYGQSEASPNVLMSHRLDPIELRISGFALPHPGIDVRLANPNTDELSESGQQGEIQVKGWNVMKGYYKLPDATAKAFTADGWLKTGDLGEGDDLGRFRMVGRLKDLYRVGGENVAPAEVEEVLHAHPAVQQAQVIGVPDARLGEVTGAFVLLRHGQEVSSEELVEWCRQRCANFKVPRYLAVIDTFEHIGMTGSSKIQKNKLREYAITLWQLDQFPEKA